MIDKKIAIPGDMVSEDPSRSGDGTYVEDGRVYALNYGVLMDSRDKIKIVPFGGTYFPSYGDVVVGVVSDVSFSNWKVDICSPYEALLHVSEYPERVNFAELDKHIKIGELIVVRITDVDPTMKIELTLRDRGLGILRGGRVAYISHSKVPRLIGRSGSMINMLKKECQCSIIVGKNGRIWVDGEKENMDLAIRAISKIEEEAHTSGLTDRMSEFLKDENEE
ncbi:MAG: exosome complex RNA-binding protein Rrp4 [Halobacteriota archaeon]|nr:exosome complex RNA-binding protein Rrp4 [Halobacteriota archaeon]